MHRLSQAGGPFPNSYQYDANGNRTVRNSENYSIDADSNRLQSISDARLNTVMTYDAAGNLIGKTTDGTGYTYQYDPHNRLENITGAQGQIAAYQYNGLGQRVVKQTGEGSEYSLYDLQGRRIVQLSGSGEVLHNILYWQGQPLAQYRTDREGVYRFLSKQKHRDAELSADINTRRIRLLRIDGSLLDTVIDAALWQIDTTGEGVVYHFAIGRGADQELKGWRHLPAGNGKGFAHIMDKTQGHPQEYRLDEREHTLNAYYYHLDHLGTPQVITDQAQHIVWQASYAAFGQTAVTTETIDNDLRFPGQYYDAESGLYYNWHRYYDPETGRYITSDPIGLNGGLNSYGYVGGNPLIYSDPKGLIIWDILDFGFFAQSLYEYYQCSSTDNAINLGLDAIGLFPGIPALGTLRRIDDAVDVTKGLVDTKNIRFTQDSIGAKFSDGRSVQGLIDDLASVKVSPNDLPAIRTFVQDGKTYTLDNRRLFAAHQAGVQMKTVPATAAEIAKELGQTH